MGCAEIHGAVSSRGADDGPAPGGGVVGYVHRHGAKDEPQTGGCAHYVRERESERSREREHREARNAVDVQY